MNRMDAAEWIKLCGKQLIKNQNFEGPNLEFTWWRWTSSSRLPPASKLLVEDRGFMWRNRYEGRRESEALRCRAKEEVHLGCLACFSELCEQQGGCLWSAVKCGGEKLSTTVWFGCFLVSVEVGLFFAAHSGFWSPSSVQLLWDRCVGQLPGSACVSQSKRVCWLGRKMESGSDRLTFTDGFLWNLSNMCPVVHHAVMLDFKDSKFLGGGDARKEECWWAQALGVLGQRRAPEGGKLSRALRSQGWRRGAFTALGSLRNLYFLFPLCLQVAKLRHQLQKRSRHAPPPAGYELPPPAGQAAGITQVALTCNAIKMKTLDSTFF